MWENTSYFYHLLLIKVHKNKCTNTNSKSPSQALAETKEDASMKTLTIRGNPEPILKFALGSETLTGKFKQNKHRMYSRKMHVCCYAEPDLLLPSLLIICQSQTHVIFLVYVQHWDSEIKCKLPRLTIFSWTVQLIFLLLYFYSRGED